MVTLFIVIEAQVPTEEDLRRKTSIQFPSVTNMSNDVTLVFGNMTPMIEIPSIVLRQLKEGMMYYVCIRLMHMYVQLQLCTYTYVRMVRTYGTYMYSSWYFLLKCIM